MTRLEFTIPEIRLPPPTNDFKEFKFVVEWAEDEIKLTINDKLIIQKGEF